jgi:flagellar hook-associated protein 2
MTSLSSLTSSTSTTTSATSISSGIGGLVSGLDIDSLVESLSAISQQKIDAQNQKLQKLEWKQDAYRTIISAMQDFQDSYLNVLSSTNVGSSKLFNTTTATSSSEAVSVSTTASSYAGSFTINSIKQLATAESMTSTSSVTSALTSTVTADSIVSNISSLTGKSISLTLDGTVKTITFDEDTFGSITTADGFVSALQTAIDDAFGVTGSSDRVVTVSKDTNGYLNFSAPGSTLSIDTVDDDTATLTALGFTDGQTNTLSTSTTLANLNLVTDQGSVGTYKFSINGVDFEFASDTSLSKMISQINTSDAGVTVSYSSITDKFTMTADDTGAGDKINVSDTSGTLMSALGMTSSTGTTTPGANAILYVNGQKIIRSSNDITVSGVNVSLEETSSDAITVTMKADSTDLKDTITKFVEDYNTMIDTINTYITEESDSDYQPLTDAQKEEMTDSQIEKWEKKAKAGVLNGDSTLKSIATKLQQAMYSSAVSGGISLATLGITSAGYNENGKLEIDEDKLTSALSSKADEIAELFTSETGLAAKLSSIFDDSIKTSGSRGSRGTLVDIAGVEDTSSATQNSLYDQMNDIEDFLDTLNDRLDAEQKRLWNKFSAMETALSNLNSQSSLLSSFTSS